MKKTFLIVIISIVVTIFYGCEDRKIDPERKCKEVSSSEGCPEFYPWTCDNSDSCYMFESGCESASSCN